MPKIVDHQERKSNIAEATWRVIIQQGIQAATVRKIAAEAGVSLGALRHYFSTQHELLLFAMNLVKERVTARILAIIHTDLPPREQVAKVLLELLPTDDGSMAEMEVWFAFTFHLRSAGDKSAELDDAIYPLIVRLIDYLDQHGLLRQGLDKGDEAERLYALVDGLAMHAMLEPERLDRERMVRVLNVHLESICFG
ncbi:TetR family transcriptional regulator C-terminal domain-containing protein [Paenibacillus tritici]|uniref:TetR/AcrR family transcriptional regulator n=1 Tax=Paenibacillus tritici TaxID=1873425 RepID=UPI001BA93669|nr:TetR family transcriptional regulator C-terminal domain-containing protein [Paenibacillus tritici]QUL58110.1 TetR family transcriptional regulator C-terminal domain-containing protein [Paenibacillus tritici]